MRLARHTLHTPPGGRACGAARSVVCSRAVSTRPRAVLFDRDGTLVVDVPYNGDPDAVRAMPGAAAALERVRAAGVPIGVVSNQSGIARGLLDAGQVEAVNARVAEHPRSVRGVAVVPARQ